MKNFTKTISQKPQKPLNKISNFTTTLRKLQLLKILKLINLDQGKSIYLFFFKLVQK